MCLVASVEAMCGRVLQRRRASVLSSPAIVGCGDSKPDAGTNFMQQVEQAQREGSPDALAKLAKLGNSPVQDRRLRRRSKL